MIRQKTQRCLAHPQLLALSLRNIRQTPVHYMKLCRTSASGVGEASHPDPNPPAIVLHLNAAFPPSSANGSYQVLDRSKPKPATGSPAAMLPTGWTLTPRIPRLAPAPGFAHHRHCLGRTA
ncbi:hypothetical protein LIA77_11840 [Sarocladium implicatum]|nr:hypothetical protein LIA77_11840 [Sarocladium implicatum]